MEKDNLSDIKLVKTKKHKKHWEYSYTIGKDTYNIKHTDRGNWELRLKNTLLARFQTSLTEIKEKLKERKDCYESTQNALKEGGWVCPKGCHIDHVLVEYTETAFGVRKHKLDDEQLDNDYESETTDYDNYETHDTICPECSSRVDWQEPENSVDFIRKL